MTDDWSLKEKSLKDLLFEAGVNEQLYGTTPEMEVNRILVTLFGYTKQDIEVLRQKLIEDINDPAVMDWHEPTRSNIEDIINRRFGVHA